MYGIGFENMKTFEQKTWLDFAQITLLTGTNNSGKSTAINAAQLLKENFKKNGDINSIGDILKIKFDLGDLAERYGNLGNFVSKGSKKNSFTFCLEVPMRFCYSEMLQANFLVELDDTSLKRGQIVRIDFYSKIKSLKIFELWLTESGDNRFYNFKINYSFFVNLFFENAKKDEEYDYDWKHLMNLLNSKAKDFKTVLHLFNKKYCTECLIQEDSQTGYSDDFEEHFCGLAYDDMKSYIWDDVNLPERRPRRQKALKQYKETSIFIDLSVVSKEFNSAFKTHLEQYYKSADFQQNVKAFDLEMAKFLSNYSFAVEEHEIDFSKTSKNSNGLYLLNAMLSEDSWQTFKGNNIFILLLDNMSNLFNLYAAFSEKKADLHLNEKDIDTIGESNKAIYTNLIKPFFYLLYDEIDNAEKYYLANKNAFVDKRLKGKYECQLIEEVFFAGVEDVLRKLNGFVRTDFVTTGRMTRKRIFSFTDENEFCQRIQNIESKKEEEKIYAYNFINKWLKEFGIEHNFVIEPIENSNNFLALLKNENATTHLADLGYGTLQILPILIALIPPNFSTRHSRDYLRKTIFIEEPEANLHPALQSKLADLFVDAINKFDIQIIAETHSEYLIRKLQYLTAKGIAKTSDSVIHYFYKPNHPAVLSGEVNQVEKIEIDEFGRLSKEFGSGFFDEADKIAMDLFLLNHSQSN